MTAPGVAWAAAILLIAMVRRPIGRPIDARTSGKREPVGLPDPITRVGGTLRRRCGRPPDGEADRRLGWALAASGPAVLVAPPVVGLIAVVWWAAPRYRRRRARARHEASVRRQLPDVVDLITLAVGAGLNVRLALEVIAPRVDDPARSALARVNHRVAIGARPADALADLPTTLGGAIRPLVAALAGAERYGTPLLPALERIGQSLRAERRRRAEEHARRIPVRLLFPLVFCALPAFALLTVVPLLVGSLRELRL